MMATPTGERVQHWLAVTATLMLLAVLALSLLAPLAAPQDPSDPLGFDPLAANHPPTWSFTYLLGADARGRSVLALLLWGGRISLAIGLGSAVLAAILGLAIGSLWHWRQGILDPLLTFAMGLCQSVPPLIVLLLLASRLGGVPVPLIVLTFVATGWVAPARITRAALRAAQSSPYVEAARALGATEWRVVRTHLLPAVLPPLAALIASSTAAYIAMEAGLDFLGLGLPPNVTSWGTALVGARDALVSGNWWWICFGGAPLAITTLTLGVVARGIAAAPGLRLYRRRTLASEAVLSDEDQHDRLAVAWDAWQPPVATARRINRRSWLAAAAGALLLSGIVTTLARLWPAAVHTPTAAALLLQAVTYPLQRSTSTNFIATASYTAPLSALPEQQIPWAARTPCPATFGAPKCAASSVQLFFTARMARAVTEGITFVCTPERTWSVNPMAGLARTDTHACGPRGPTLSGLGATAGAIEALLPDLTGPAQLIGSDQVAGRACWLLALDLQGRACIDAATGLVLRLERRDRFNHPVARFEIAEISYGLDLAAELFTNPIPGGHGPLISGLTQPLLNLQAADDQALFFALVPTYVPPGLTAETPAFDQFNDQRQNYALAQRVRQTFRDRSGRVALVLIETLAGCAWDVTPPRRLAQSVPFNGHALLIWPGTAARPALVRTQLDVTTALVSSQSLPLLTLERVAAGLR